MGKKILIKVFDQVVPTYSMNTFRFPDNLYRDINVAITRFWSGVKKERKEKKIHWLVGVYENLLLNGAYWQILGGDQTKLLVEMWILAIASGPPIHPFEVTFDMNQIVSSIVQRDSWSWQVDPIREMLSTDDHYANLDIPIEDLKGEDRFIWHVSRKRKYSMKSEYYWLHNKVRRQQIQHPSSLLHIDSYVWKCIWRMKAPPK
ncbi:hypothetical protein ACFX1X_009385 [Malus domestica]